MRLKWSTFLSLLILGLALGLRIHFLYSIPPNPPSPDEIGYRAMAEQFLDRGILGYKSDKPNAFVTPGYPLFLAGLYALARPLGLPPDMLVRTIQVLLSTATVWLVFLLGRQLGGLPAGYLGGVLAAVYPPFLYANARILTESLFTFVFTGYAYMALISLKHRKPWPHALTGAMLALATLVRPAAAPILVVPYLLLWVRHRKKRIWLFFLAALAGFSLVMLPWWIRNYLVLHKIVFLATQTGNPFLRGAIPFDPYGHTQPGLIENTPQEEQLKAALQKIREGLKTNPGLWISWYTTGKLEYLWSRPWGSAPYLQWLSLPLHRLVTILAALGALISIWRVHLRWPATIYLYFTLVQLAFIPLARYMFPILPVVIALAGAVLTLPWQKTRNH